MTPVTRLKRVTLALAPAFLMLAAIGCSTASEPVDADPASLTVSAPAVEEGRPDIVPLIKGPVSEDGLQAIFATPDLGVGKNRFAFVLTSADGLSRVPVATVSSFYLPDDGAEPEHKQTALAVFHSFPYVTRGIYSTRLDFDKPGKWSVKASLADDGGGPRSAMLFFDVAETASAPAVGAPAI